MRVKKQTAQKSVSLKKIEDYKLCFEATEFRKKKLNKKMK